MTLAVCLKNGGSFGLPIDLNVRRWPDAAIHNIPTSLNGIEAVNLSVKFHAGIKTFHKTHKNHYFSVR